MRTLNTAQENFALKHPFKIAHGTRYNADVIVVSITENGTVGYGEAVPYLRYAETCKSVITQIQNIAKKINSGITIEALQNIIPNGAARNAIDCALWDLKSKLSKQTIWEIAKLPKPQPTTTVITLVIDTPDKLALKAKEKSPIFPTLKLKLAGDQLDEERIRAVHNAAPKSDIIIDANESWRKDQYLDLIKTCQESNVTMIEQPFKAQEDHILHTLPKPITICADESCHNSKDLPNLIGKYRMVNIKLDKTGGLTEAMLLLNKAKQLNFKIMVGCMVSTSLSIRPAYYLAQMADLIDIDGPILLKQDRKNGLIYNGSSVSELP